MSLIFADSFDHYEYSGGAHVFNGKWDTATASRRVGRRGTWGAHTGDGIQKIIPDTTEIIIGYALWMENGGPMPTTRNNGLGGIRLGNDVSDYLILSIGMSGQIRLRRGAYPYVDEGEINEVGQETGDMLWTSANNVFQFFQWNFLEFKAIIATDATGAYAVRLNGQTLVNVSGVRTVPIGRGFTNPGYIPNFHLRENQIVDDLYVLSGDGSRNNDFLGDLQVDLRQPDGAGLRSDSVIVGTSPAATRWQSNLTADHGVTAVELGATDDSDSYTFEDLPYAAAEVFGVLLTTQARKSDGGPIRLTLTNDVDAVAVDAQPEKLSVSAGDVFAYQHAALDEAASGPWTLERFQDSEFGTRRENV